MLVVSFGLFLIAGEFYLTRYSDYGIIQKIDLTGVDPYLYNAKRGLFVDKYRLKYRSRNQANNINAIFLGDSITDGDLFDVSKTNYPNVLKGLIEEKYKGLTISPYILAEGGWSTFQEVFIFEKQVKVLNPDLVFLQYCHNDAFESKGRVRKERDRNYLVCYKTDVAYIAGFPFNKFLTEKFIIFRVLNSIGIAVFRKLKLNIGIDSCLNADKEIYENLQRLAFLASSKNLPVILIEVPYLSDSPEVIFSRMRNKLKEWSDEFSFQYVSLFEEYKKYSYKDLKIKPDDEVHPNELGHKIAAEYIFKKLQENDRFQRIVQKKINSVVNGQ